MKKSITLIIALLVSFSIPSGVFAIQSIDSLLEIQSGVEGFDISRVKLEQHSFRTDAIKNVYEDFHASNDVLRSEILKKYRNWEFSYYQMQWIVKSYKQFVYNTNKLFWYLAIKDSWFRGKTIDTAILRSYQNIRIHYNRMKHLIWRSY